MTTFLIILAVVFALLLAWAFCRGSGGPPPPPGGGGGGNDLGMDLPTWVAMEENLYDD